MLQKAIQPQAGAPAPATGADPERQAVAEASKQPDAVDGKMLAALEAERAYWSTRLHEELRKEMAKEHREARAKEHREAWAKEQIETMAKERAVANAKYRLENAVYTTIVVDDDSDPDATPDRYRHGIGATRDASGQDAHIRWDQRPTIIAPKELCNPSASEMLAKCTCGCDCCSEDDA